MTANTAMLSSNPCSVLPLRTIARLVDLPTAFMWFGFEGALDVLEERRVQKSVALVEEIRDALSR